MAETKFENLIVVNLVRADGIEPTIPAWKAEVLPLNYARKHDGQSGIFAHPVKHFV